MIKLTKYITKLSININTKFRTIINFDNDFCDIPHKRNRVLKTWNCELVPFKKKIFLNNYPNENQLRNLLMIEVWCAKRNELFRIKQTEIKHSKFKKILKILKFSFKNKIN